ncbi:MAG: hypothetical protein KDI30_06470, partial [Pseudomonadales bacterium]|nr:hypothetical protein [Pseudomonadales bacterium]
MRTQAINLLQKLSQRAFFCLFLVLICQTAQPQTLDLSAYTAQEDQKITDRNSIEKTKKEISERLRNTSDTEIISELNKNITNLDRQLIILDELERQQFESSPQLTLPDESQHISISRYDLWL